MAAALARAEATKLERAEVAAKMSASQQAAAVAEAQKAQLEANREKLAAKQAEVANRALDFRMAKVDKAARMSGSPTSTKSREESTAGGETGATPRANNDDTDLVADSASSINTTSETNESLAVLAVPAGIAAVPQPTETPMLDAATSTAPLFMTPEGTEESNDKANDEVSSNASEK